MREIKFRAWDKNSEAMITDAGFLSLDGSGLVAVFNDDEGEWNTDILDYILMQYTGLQDRNKGEVYETDLYARNGIIWEVYFDEIAFQWRLCANGDKQFDKTYALPFVHNSHFKHVGNKFENPEVVNQ